ncbi:MAG TPA: 50S ribosomal protein L25 [Conexibacter sp.]|jgi:large subunit ribosomal protein L25|nr:50S ribosomal protein L25 [Conexibacter sp.]
MADDTTTLTVAPRTVEGSRGTRRLRRTGLVPGVVYGGEGAPIAFEVDARILRQALAHGGAVITLTVEGEGETPVVLKDQQRHPVTGDTMHVDLLRVDLRQKIAATVVVELTGSEDAPGVKAGGVLEQVTRELNVEALPAEIPDTIELDVSSAEIGDTITLEAVVAPAGVTLLDDAETVVVTLTPPRLSTEADEEIEQETEVVGEGAEGEPAAEGDSSGGGE